VYIYIDFVYVPKKFYPSKLYATYILLVPGSRCILYCDFNVKNAFKFSLFPSSVQVHYSTENSGLHFLKSHENIVFLVSNIID